MEVRYPEVEVQLVGTDGNAFALMAAVSTPLKRYLRDESELSGAEIAAEIKTFHEEAMSGDYNNLICVCNEWVTCH